VEHQNSLTEPERTAREIAALPREVAERMAREIVDAFVDAAGLELPDPVIAAIASFLADRGENEVGFFDWHPSRGRRIPRRRVVVVLHHLGSGAAWNVAESHPDPEPLLDLFDEAMATIEATKTYKEYREKANFWFARNLFRDTSACMSVQSSARCHRLREHQRSGRGGRTSHRRAPLRRASRSSSADGELPGEHLGRLRCPRLGMAA
jgi:hypothetical protein